MANKGFSRQKTVPLKYNLTSRCSRFKNVMMVDPALTPSYLRREFLGVEPSSLCYSFELFLKFEFVPNSRYLNCPLQKWVQYFNNVSRYLSGRTRTSRSSRWKWITSRWSSSL